LIKIVRRRIEGKTDYRRRLALLKSGKTRLVVRKMNRYIIVQFIDYNKNGDIVRACAVSKELLRYGWKHGTKNLPAAYLTGYLTGLRAIKEGINEAVLDIGRHPSTKGSRLYAALKGAIDAGISVNYGEEILPDESRIRGAHIAEYARIIKEKDEEAFKRRFSDILKRGADPLLIEKDFDDVLNRIREVVP
jgi:large subunit ribosomal protein L18